MPIESSELVKLGWSGRFRFLILYIILGLVLAGAATYWTVVSVVHVSSNVAIREDLTKAVVNELQSLHTELREAYAEISSILGKTDVGSTIDPTIKQKILNVGSKLREAEARVNVLEAITSKGLSQPSEKRSNLSVPMFGVSSAYAETAQSSGERNAPIFDRQTRIIVMFIILSVIIAITIACFAILFFSATADTVTFAKDTLKAAGGFYFGIMNGFLGTT